MGKDTASGLAGTYVGRLVEHEQALAELYAAFAEALPSMRRFWRRLSVEEIRHSSAVIDLQNRHHAGEVHFEPRDFDLGDIVESLDYIDNLLGSTEQNGIERRSALRAAAVLEQGAIEHRFFEVFEGDSDEIRELFETLRRLTEKHLKAIRRKT